MKVIDHKRTLLAALTISAALASASCGGSGSGGNGSGGSSSSSVSSSTSSTSASSSSSSSSVTGYAPGTESTANVHASGVRAQQVAITGLSNGNYVVAWNEMPSDVVYCRIFDASGVALTAPLRATSSTNGHEETPALAGLAGGGFVIAWADSSGTLGDDAGIAAQRFDANGNKIGTATLVNTSTSNLQFMPRVRALSNGGYLIAWATSLPSPATTDSVSAQSFSAAGIKVGAETALPPVSNSVGDYFDLVVLTDGKMVEAWRGGTALGPKAELQLLDAAGHAQGSPFYVTNDGTNTDQPVLSPLSGGGFVVSWNGSLRPSGGFSQVFASSGSRVGTMFSAPLQTGETVSGTAVTGLKSGGYGLVYFPSTVRSQAFTSDGAVLGAETAVSSGSPNTSGAVGAGAGGGYLVGWISDQTVSDIHIRAFTPLP